MISSMISPTVPRMNQGDGPMDVNSVAGMASVSSKNSRAMMRVMRISSSYCRGVLTFTGMLSVWGK